jgi:hypothetical protein
MPDVKWRQDNSSSVHGPATGESKMQRHRWRRLVSDAYPRLFKFERTSLAPASEVYVIYTFRDDLDTEYLSIEDAEAGRPFDDS